MINQELSTPPEFVNAERAPYFHSQNFSSPDDDPEESKRTLSEYLWILKRYRRSILAFVSTALIATFLISARLTPIYESTATIDIDRQTPPGVVGEDATRNTLTDADQFLATQMKLVESDNVLRPVDQRFELRQAEGQSAALRTGGEQTPVVLKRLRVTRPPNTYLILINYRSADPQLAADAANAIAQSYLENSFQIRLRSAASIENFMERQMEDLKVKMERSGQAVVAFERELNVISPEEKTNMLAARLLQLNAEFTAAQAARLKSEAAYQSVTAGSLESALAAPQGEELRRLVEHSNEARERFAEVKSHYGANHPEYRKAQAQLAEVQTDLDVMRQQVVERVGIQYAESQRHEGMMNAALAGAKTEFDRVNARSFDYQALKREAEGDRTLYEQLVRRIKEAGINAGFQSNAVRIADRARPALKPVYPNTLLNVMLALLFSTLAAAGAAIGSDMLDTTVRDPEQVARTLHTEVLGSLPLLKDRPAGALRALVESVAPDGEADTSGFNESIRTLRNSILLANFENRYRSLMVTSAAPGDGKTTTAANLAAVHAGQGKKTLLIDGDLRRPSVHRNFNVPSVVGLFNVLMGEIQWRDGLLSVDGIPNLSILPAGPPTRRASDLVGRSLSELIEEASAGFDLIVLDAPPLLGFAEPLQMATAVDGVVIVARAGQTTRKAVASVLTTLSRLRVKVIGVVLNEVHKELSDSYYYYGYAAAATTKGAQPELYFHFDSWRLHVAGALWVPAQIYIEEEGSDLGGGPGTRFKAQSRVWDYAASPGAKLDELTSILVESSGAVKDDDTSKDVSPLESQRSWERQAEENLLARLEKGGLIAPAGPLDGVLNTVVNNLVISSKLGVEVHCRVLLTTPIETFAIGRTIVISRGLVDVLPDEASLALVLADQLSHIVLGHRTPTRYAFTNQTMVSEPEILQHLRFERTAVEMVEAGKQTIEIIGASPYSNTANAGLFLKALAAHTPELPNLFHANLGDQIADTESLARLQHFADAAPALEDNKLEQIAALPLGSRVKLNPWDNHLELIQTRPLSLLSAREKMPFEVTPFVLYLTRSDAVAAK